MLNCRGKTTGSLRSPCRTPYRSSIGNLAPNCLVLRKITFLCTDFGDRQTDGQTDRQTNEHMDSVDA